MTTTKSLGFAGSLALGLICCALASCTSSDSGSPTGSGGTGAGQGGTSGGSAGTTGAGTGTAGTTGSGATTGSGGVSTGGSGAGASTGTAGDGAGTGGTLAGTGGALSGTAGAGTAGSGAATGGSAGASAGTSGTAGAAGAGAGGAGGASDCNGAALCDSFERTMLGADWKLDNTAVPASVVEIVTDKGHTGTNSVHIKYGTGSVTASFIDETLGFPVMNNSIWGRVWFFMMTGTESGHHVFIEASDGMAVQMNGVRPLNTQGNIATNIDPPDSGGTSKVAMPQGVWTCFEWHIAAAAGKTNVNLYMNGTEVPGTAASVTATGNNVVSSLIETRIGYERYGTGAAGEMWMDDFAVGPTQIGCGP